MGNPERIYELVKRLPEEQVSEVLDFVEFLQQKNQKPALSATQASSTLNPPPHSARTIPKGTLTGLRGIAKRSGPAPSDEELREEYTQYLIAKYQ